MEIEKSKEVDETINVPFDYLEHVVPSCSASAMYPKHVMKLIENKSFTHDFIENAALALSQIWNLNCLGDALIDFEKITQKNQEIGENFINACNPWLEPLYGREIKMGHHMMMKQIIDFQKTTFDNSYNAMAMLQEQGEKMIEMLLNQTTWIPNEKKKAVLDCVNYLKKGRDNFKKNVEVSFTKMENSFCKAEKKK